MKTKKWSLRKILIGSLLGIVIIIVAAFIVLLHYDYNFLYEEKGRQMTSALSRHAQSEVEKLLMEPMLMNQFFREGIQEASFYLDDDLRQVEELQKKIIHAYGEEIPQASVLSYGDELGRYAGLRINQDGTPNVMIKDQRTNDHLIIFEDESIQSKPSLVIEDYDLHQRPFYQPLISHPVASWSSLYVNQDEKMEVTVTHILPIFDSLSQFTGVTAVDISLHGLQRHLQKDEIVRSGQGVIYIVDESWNLVAHSGQEDWIHVSEDTGEVTIDKAFTLHNPLIQHSASYFMNHQVPPEVPVQVQHQSMAYYTVRNPLAMDNLPNWQVIVSLPEEGLMGPVKERQQYTVMLILAFVSLVTGLSIWWLTKITTPIQQTSKAAKEIAAGNWDVPLPITASSVDETHQLVTSFHQMAVSLEATFEKLHHSKKKYQDLFHDKSEELKFAMRELIDREKLASLGGLVAGISHEINTPLGISISSVSYICHQTQKVSQQLEAGSLTEEGLYGYFHDLQESLKLLEDNLERSAHLVNSFKEVAVHQNIESKQSFRLKEVIRNVVVSLKHEYKHQHHQFQINCPEDLWIDSYPGVFSQILTNLIMNSLLHGLGHKPHGIITIALEIEDRSLGLTYSDNGSGMTEEVQHRIFEPFYTTRRGQGSSGLGMSIVHSLVTQKLGGSISCFSQENQGTTFTIQVPVEDSPAKP